MSDRMENVVENPATVLVRSDIATLPDDDQCCFRELARYALQSKTIILELSYVK